MPNKDGTGPMNKNCQPGRKARNGNKNNGQGCRGRNKRSGCQNTRNNGGQSMGVRDGNQNKSNSSS